jgi:hypothetical protein
MTDSDCASKRGHKTCDKSMCGNPATFGFSKDLLTRRIKEGDCKEDTELCCRVSSLAASEKNANDKITVTVTVTVT